MKEKFWNLNVGESIERLKKMLEDYGYLVVTFLDLKADDFLRVVFYFRKYLERLQKSCSVLVYVGGHGFNSNHQDYLVPIDHILIYHNNNHSDIAYRREFSSSTLHNLLQSFVSPSLMNKVQVDCLWDLCRVK